MLNKKYRKIRQNIQAIKNRVGILLLGQRRSRRVLKLSPTMKILNLRYDDKLGDMVINTFMLREIRKAYPHCTLDVVVGQKNKSVLTRNPYVTHLHVYNRSFFSVFSLGLRLRKEKYDLLIELSDKISWRVLFFIRLIGARFNLGLLRQDVSLFDESIETKSTPIQHTTERYTSVLNRLGADTISDYSYDLSLENSVVSRIEKLPPFLNQHKKKIVLFNRFGASKHRTISSDKVVKTIDLLLKNTKNMYFVLLTPPEFATENLAITNSFYGRDVDIILTPSFYDLTAAIHKSDLVITPDTAIVHIAEALQKNLIGIYLNAEKAKQWSALSTSFENIFARNPDETDTFSETELLEKIHVLMPSPIDPQKAAPSEFPKIVPQEFIKK